MCGRVQWLFTTPITGTGEHSHSCGSERPGQRGQLTPPSLKFGAEIRNCIWRLCLAGVKVMAMTTCLTLIHWRPRVCIHVQRNEDNIWPELRCGRENQRVMLHDKTWFLTLASLCWKMVSKRLRPHGGPSSKIVDHFGDFNPSKSMAYLGYFERERVGMPFPLSKSCRNAWERRSRCLSV